MSWVGDPSVFAPRSGELATTRRVAKLVLGGVPGNIILLTVRVKGRLDVVPVVDANPASVPVRWHCFRLDVEVRVHSLGTNIQCYPLAILQFLLDIIRQLEGFGELRPRPVSVPALFNGLVKFSGSPSLRSIGEDIEIILVSLVSTIIFICSEALLLSFEIVSLNTDLPTINAHINALNLFPTTRPRYALNCN